jgi:hypothetical protein
MEAKNALLALILAPTLLGAPLEARSKEIPLRLQYSGSGMSHWDTDPSLVKPGMGILECKSNLGRCSAQAVGHAALGGPKTCPNGDAGIELILIPGTGHGFMRFEKTGDLLFNELTSETVCYDPSKQIQFKSGAGKFTGGTGRFVGASGQFQFEGTQWVLYGAADGNGFAAQNGTITGTITLP